MQNKEFFLAARYRTNAGVLKTVNLQTGQDVNQPFNREKLLRTHYLVQVGIKQGGSISLALPAMSCFLNQVYAQLP